MKQGLLTIGIEEELGLCRQRVVHREVVRPVRFVRLVVLRCRFLLPRLLQRLARVKVLLRDGERRRVSPTSAVPWRRRTCLDLSRSA